MKWPIIGLSITVMFFSVTPCTWKGFVQSFEVDGLLQLGANIQTQAEKAFSLPIKSEENGKKKMENIK